eukprot:CAMPEP_0177630256 /NCGR_PEP_ID=MMETSP0447-20121125/1114_1 /TAXON_ID=0 /ORGANISM="Stygamoeba regulata, Strain BSH-02190019" /LENGTH=172 /DNA_ID=CAMNT_0019131651 /DNA_START=416 /DNA_END=934 /DNA_ORIENTATION=-
MIAGALWMRVCGGACAVACISGALTDSVHRCFRGAVKLRNGHGLLVGSPQGVKLQCTHAASAVKSLPAAAWGTLLDDGLLPLPLKEVRKVLEEDTEKRHRGLLRRLQCGPVFGKVVSVSQSATMSSMARAVLYARHLVLSSWAAGRSLDTHLAFTFSVLKPSPEVSDDPNDA